MTKTLVYITLINHCNVYKKEKYKKIYGGENYFIDRKNLIKFYVLYYFKLNLWKNRIGYINTFLHSKY